MLKPACHNLQFPPAGLHYFHLCGFQRWTAQNMVALTLFTGVALCLGLPAVLNYIFSCIESKEQKRKVAFGSRD